VAQIHDSAVVGADVTLGENSVVGPFCVIEDGVTIGADCHLESSVRVYAGATIGDRNTFMHGACIGGLPQSLGFDPQTPSGVRIGQDNTFREYFTVHRSIHENGATVIGDHNFLMGLSHIAHDCLIGNENVIANGALIAGHITIGDHSFISGNAIIHQFCHIGDYVMISGGARIGQDLPHYVTAMERNTVCGLNAVGLRRGEFAAEDRRQIKQAYKIMYKQSLSRDDILKTLRAEQNPYAERLADFISNSERGVCPGK